MQVSSKANILMVDDRPENLFALEAALTDLGENLIKANSGEQALRCVLNQDFAVILLDVQMPTMDGFEIAALIREREKSRYTPIIFLTAFDKNDADVFRGYSSGAVDFLFKPIVPRILQAKVTTFVDLYKKTQEIHSQTVQIEIFNRELEQQLMEVKRLNQALESSNKALEKMIAENKQTEEALLRSENLYRTLAQHLPQTSVFLFDQELRYVLVEGPLLEKWGVSTKTMKGKTLQEVLPPDLSLWIARHRAVFEGKQSAFEQLWNDNTYFVQIMPVENEQGEIFAGIVMLQDITELRQVTHALQEAHDKLELRVKERTADLNEANEELKKFTYLVSHDFRAPLINLKGFAAELDSAVKTIREGIGDDLSYLSEAQAQAIATALHTDIPEALHFITAAVDRMDHLTTAILKLSQLGRRELKLESLDMNVMIRAILDSVAHQIKEKQVTVNVGQLPNAFADRIAMEQIMGNILTNAILYLSLDRPGEIEVTGESLQDELVFHVRDNGRGIAAEDDYKIFEPFRRAGKHDIPGEGMGLAFVQALVRRHGGRIWYESQFGVGTTFSFSIAKMGTDYNDRE